ncbi:TPM domain-containing protein [Paracoccaceae bacterium Fryx2]|nr:TPM domain-containing protein [Paracoccaceae bacterium Fryx2]
MIRLAIFLVLWPLAVLAQGLPEPRSAYINDFADLIDPDTESRIEAALAAARADTGMQVTLVTIAQAADHGAASVEAFARDLFNAWGVGDRLRNDGILIVVAGGDRAVRIELGDGIPPVWDGVALRVIDTVMLPAFRDGRMAAGIEAGTGAVLDRIVRPITANLPPPAAPFNPVPWGIAGLVAAGVLWQQVRKRRAQATGAARLPVAGRTGRGVPDRDDRQGVDQGDDPRARRPNPPGGDDDGFGGGKSSGGGASGRW